MLNVMDLEGKKGSVISKTHQLTCTILPCLLIALPFIILLLFASLSVIAWYGLWSTKRRERSNLIFYFQLIPIEKKLHFLLTISNRFQSGKKCNTDIVGEERKTLAQGTFMERVCLEQKRSQIKETRDILQKGVTTSILIVHVLCPVLKIHVSHCSYICSQKSLKSAERRKTMC